MGEEFVRRIMVLGDVPSLGPVIVFDDMEFLLKWTKSGTGGDSLLEKSATVAYNKDASLHLKTRTTNGVEGDAEVASRVLYQRSGKRYAFECIWMPDAAAGAKETIFEADIYDGALLHQVALKYDKVNDKWLYFAAGPAFTDVPGGAQSLQTGTWHRLRFEFDEASGLMRKMESDALLVDMSTLSYYSTASVVAVRLHCKITVVAGATPPGEVYVDDVLVMEI